jgi:flagellar basal body-associated protein FliL
MMPALPPLRRSKPVIFVLAMLCALATAVPAAQASGGEGSEKKEHAKAKAPKKTRSITSLASWVTVDTFTVTIIQDGRLRGRFTVTFGMDVPDDALREKAEELMPRLRDAWLSDLSLYAATTLRPRRAADIAAISDLLRSGADRVLGKAGSKVLMAQARVDMTP